MSTGNAVKPQTVAASASRCPLATRNGPKPSSRADSAVAKTPDPVSSKLIGKTTPGAGAAAAPTAAVSKTLDRRSRRNHATPIAAATPDDATPKATACHDGTTPAPDRSAARACGTRTARRRGGRTG